MENTSVNLDATDQLLIICCALVKFLKKREYFEVVARLFIDLKKPVCDSVEREVLYNILIGIGITVTVVRLIKICLAETYS
jgi:hypothetical protein